MARTGETGHFINGRKTKKKGKEEESWDNERWCTWIEKRWRLMHLFLSIEQFHLSSKPCTIHRNLERQLLTNYSWQLFNLNSNQNKPGEVTEEAATKRKQKSSGVRKDDPYKVYEHLQLSLEEVCKMRHHNNC